MPLVYSIIHARLETIFTTMSCFTFVPTCKNGWHIVQLLGKKMAIAENAKQTTLKWLAMACTLSKVGIFQIIKSFQQSNHELEWVKTFWTRVKRQNSALNSRSYLVDPKLFGHSTTDHQNSLMQMKRICISNKQKNRNIQKSFSQKFKTAVFRSKRITAIKVKS